MGLFSFLLVESTALVYWPPKDGYQFYWYLYIFNKESSEFVCQNIFPHTPRPTAHMYVDKICLSHLVLSKSSFFNSSLGNSGKLKSEFHLATTDLVLLSPFLLVATPPFLCNPQVTSPWHCPILPSYAISASSYRTSITCLVFVEHQRTLMKTSMGVAIRVSKINTCVSGTLSQWPFPHSLFTTI